MTVSIFNEKVPYSFGKIFTLADLAAPVGAFPGVALATRIDQLIVASDDTVDHDLTLWITNDGNTTPVGTIRIPAGSGVAVATPAVELISSLPPLGDGCAFFNGGYFSLSDPVAISAAKTLYVQAIGGLI